jgi:hypothetical protein
MKKIVMVTIGLIWATTSYGSDLGDGAVGQSSWLGKGPDYFLNVLPTPPGNGCPGRDDEIKSFREKLLKARKDLTDEMGKRQRALKKWNEQNSKKMMENAVDMPGFEGKSQAEMKKMSKAERKKMAEKMMQDKFGVSLDDLKAQKKANREGKTMANVDFAKTMAGEMQVNDLMKSKGEREADKQNIADVGKLTKAQNDLAKQLYGSTTGRAVSKLEELDKDKSAKGMREMIYNEEDALAAMLGSAYKRPKDVDYSKIIDVLRRQGKLDENYESSGFEGTNLAAELDALPQVTPHETGDNSSCQAKEDQCSRIHTARMSYCNYIAPKLLEIITEWRGVLLTSQNRYLELDRLVSELQQAQTGIGLPDAMRGLSGLEAIQRYAAVLGAAYGYNPGEDRCKDLFCGGEQPGSSGESQ